MLLSFHRPSFSPAFHVTVSLTCASRYTPQFSTAAEETTRLFLTWTWGQKQSVCHLCWQTKNGCFTPAVQEAHHLFPTCPTKQRPFPICAAKPKNSPFWPPHQADPHLCWTDKMAASHLELRTPTISFFPALWPQNAFLCSQESLAHLMGLQGDRVCPRLPMVFLMLIPGHFQGHSSPFLHFRDLICTWIISCWKPHNFLSERLCASEKTAKLKIGNPSEVMNQKSIRIPSVLYKLRTSEKQSLQYCKKPVNSEAVSDSLLLRRARTATI